MTSQTEARMSYYVTVPHRAELTHYDAGRRIIQSVPQSVEKVTVDLSRIGWGAPIHWLWVQGVVNACFDVRSIDRLEFVCAHPRLSRLMALVGNVDRCRETPVRDRITVLEC